MSTQTAGPGPITSLAAPSEQHLLFLFLPVKTGQTGDAEASAQQSFQAIVGSPDADPGPDTRALTGVHFSMFYALKAGTTPGLPVPSFQTAEGKDLLIAVAIYDSNFIPYISAFTSQPRIAAGLDLLLGQLDESGIVPPTDPTSAAFILANGGVAVNNDEFIQLLMRYNFGDPAIPGAAKQPVNTPANPKYTLGATFPGMTVGNILRSYPDAQTLWPWPPVEITFAPAGQ
jgi:hypothetical protein